MNISESIKNRTTYKTEPHLQGSDALKLQEVNIVISVNCVEFSQTF